MASVTLLDVVQQKTCTDCRTSKPVSSFTKERRGKYGVKSKCKRCVRVRERAYREANKDKYKAYYTKTNKEAKESGRRLDWYLQSTYGITLDEYTTILTTQCGKCAICGTTDKGRYNRFYVDHCHTTGVVRGLLCEACNYLLGHAYDNQTTLIAAARYLQEHENGTNNTT